MDGERFDEFLRGEYARVVGAVGLVCGDRAAAEDSVCEAMVRAWERLHRGGAIESLPAWITTVAINHARSWGRRRGAHARALDRFRSLQRDAGDAVSSAEAALDMRRALGSLPRRQREVVVMRYYLDQDIRSIGKALGISEGSVKVSLSRARHSLGQTLLSETEPTRDGSEP